MDLSFLSKMGLSMDDIGKIGEIIMSGGDDDKIAEEISAKFGMDKDQAGRKEIQSKRQMHRMQEMRQPLPRQSHPS